MVPRAHGSRGTPLHLGPWLEGDGTSAGQSTAIGPTGVDSAASLGERRILRERWQKEEEDSHHFLKARFHFGLSESH